MTPVRTMRRAVAKIRHDEAADAIPHIGHKQVHQFWPLLSPCFREVLVAPHHRTDEDAVTWTWRESEDAEPPSAAELDELRRRFESALDRFSRDVAAGKVGRGSGSSTAGAAGNAEQLEAVMTTVVKEFVGRSDADLKRYVCRTEHGLRVHSWGAGAPARPMYPDTHGLEIAGRVLVAGQPARHDVVLESTDGETIAEVPSDEAGEFSFSKLSPGEYRLRARSVRGTFPPNGLPVELQQRSVKGLVLADTRTESESPLVSARRAAGRRSRRLIPVAVATVLAAGGAWWGWRTFNAPDGRGAAATPAAPATATSRADRTEPPSMAAAPGRVETPAPAGSTSGASAAGPAGGGMNSLSAAGGSERRALSVEGREPGSGALPGSSAGVAAGGSVPPPTGSSSGATPAGVPPVASSNLRLPTPPSAQASVVSAGGTPSGPAPVAAATAAPAPSARPPLPAPAAPAAAAPASASPAPAAPAAAPAVAAASKLEPSPDPIAPTVVTASPAEAPVPPADVKRPAPDGADGDVRRPEVSREAAESVSSSARVVVSETVPEKVIPATPVPAVVIPAPVVVTVPVPVNVRPVNARPAPVPLTRTVRVRVSPWRSRLLADSILPTAPTLMSQPEPVAVLRARLLAEQEARLPQAFRDVDGRFGVTLELDADIADEALTWLDEAGSPAENARVAGQQAEILWPASADETERVYRLTRRDGGMVAEVRVTGNGRDFSLRAIEQSRAWLRLAVRVTPSAAASAATSPDAKGIEWRSAAAGPLPPGWRDAQDRGAADERSVEIPLGSVQGAAALQAGALFDSETGWAILADVRQAADRPLGQ
ncbi:MAG: hypothetical protein JNL92_04135 [Opitutaceae bacterium]|nr:hypothetical protein [Opitutaceae bacterium]